METLCVDLR